MLLSKTWTDDMEDEPMVEQCNIGECATTAIDLTRVLDNEQGT